MLLFIAIITSCKSIKLHKALNQKTNTSFFNNQFTGLYIYDIVANKTLYNYNGNKYFTPASNTKIFTLFTALEMLSDSIPAFKYAVNKDTITIQGTGDPSFLHPYFNDSTALKKTKKFKNVHLIINNISDKRYGPGWAWEDFDAYFSAERSAFPMYGDVITISKKNDSLKIYPSYFKNKVTLTDNFYGRDEYKNNFYYAKNRTKETEIPILIDSALIANLWNNIAPNKVSIINNHKQPLSKIAYSIPRDSLCKRMMELSDNFLAEQILILASSTLSDTLSSKKAIQFMLANQLKTLEQKPRWVDGSGLSRYNLFTPKSFVTVLTKMYKQFSKKRVFNLFPIGGKSGTLKSWYKGNPSPYIYAKSGTLGNNYNLSGYLVTNSGKVLVFSYMNNHFLHQTKDVKKQMQATFEWLRDTY
ncbi:D-alanyl-D-alanine carboxypeptidase/D-alanyl-D-alanine-endopeptidase [Tenacibaculum sp. UWU-22]|uniref:D-alanyl-D-alanine carboxypeptidase/D-alanyl-D-alanine-endopeptidase n=1 Tax=Tenacibaculum sp. UWU-22 TaxID=3234187 RepID=UPI0034DAE1AA